MLDLFLWLGPRLSMAGFIRRLAATLTAPAVTRPELADQAALAREALVGLGERFNLFSALSTFPVGIPSLMAAVMPEGSPLGPPGVVPLTGPAEIGMIWFGLTVAGLLAAAAYHMAVARVASPGAESGAGWAVAVRLLAMAGLAYAVLFVVASGSVLAAMVANLITPFLATGVFYLGFTILFWLGVYLVFTPHGLVRYRLGLLRAARESVRIVRRDFFPVVGFLAVIVLLSWISGLVWELPPADSWFSALAILGHAFVSGMLLAATYVFYIGRREAMLAADRPAPVAGETSIDRRDARGA